MPSACCVPLCSGRGGASFPQDPASKNAWRLAIKRLDPESLTKLWMPTKNARVCHVHFKETDFIIKNGRRLIRKGVVPTVFPFAQTHSTEASERELRHKKREVVMIEKVRQILCSLRLCHTLVTLLGIWWQLSG